MPLLSAAALSSGEANIGFTFMAGLNIHMSNCSMFALLTLFTIDSTPDESILLLARLLSTVRPLIA